MDFAAKVRWRMKYQKTPIFVELQDKYRVRDYASSKGVKTVPLLYATTEPETIPFDDLPSAYFIKANHGCGWNILCFDSNLYLFQDGHNLVNDNGSFLNKAAAAQYQLTRQEVIDTCRQWLQQSYLEGEWAYHHIEPKIIVESIIAPRVGDELKDYRCYTFRGEVKAINIGSALYRKRKVNAFFTPNWDLIPLTRYKEALPDLLPPPPDRLLDMLAIARQLGMELDFVRIDLYDTSEGILLGEMTIYPEGGRQNTPTTCPVFNTWLAEQWQLGPVDTVVALSMHIQAKIKERHQRR